MGRNACRPPLPTQLPAQRSHSVPHTPAYTCMDHGPLSVCQRAAQLTPALPDRRQQDAPRTHARASQPQLRSSSARCAPLTRGRWRCTARACRRGWSRYGPWSCRWRRSQSHCRPARREGRTARDGAAAAGGTRCRPGRCAPCDRTPVRPKGRQLRGSRWKCAAQAALVAPVPADLVSLVAEEVDVVELREELQAVRLVPALRGGTTAAQCWARGGAVL
jgi:hypothetical protein